MQQVHSQGLNARTAATRRDDRIHLSPPDVTALEEDALVRAIRSGWIAPLGPELDAFENDLAELCHRDYCVALSSGTAALHLALLALGVERGDLVLTSTMTFAATANAIVYTGAQPVFVDCDSSGNMNPHLLDYALRTLSTQHESVKAILPVDLLGKIADYETIETIAAARGIPVLSDAAESLGAYRHGRPAASFGAAAAVSFNGNKIATTSGGGALLTDDPRLASRARYLSTQARQPAVHYEHTEIGYNYRLSNILAALGRAQLQRLQEMIERRTAWRNAYRTFAQETPGVSLLGEPSEDPASATRDNCWLTSILVDSEESGFSRDETIQALAEANIESRPLWKPMHLQPVFSRAPRFIDGTSEHMFHAGVTLPSGSAMTDSEFHRILTTLSQTSLGDTPKHGTPQPQ